MCDIARFLKACFAYSGCIHHCSVCKSATPGAETTQFIPWLTNPEAVQGAPGVQCKHLPLWFGRRWVCSKAHDHWASKRYQ